LISGSKKVLIVKSLAAGVLLLLSSAATPAQAQTRQGRRETNANRKLRVAREIRETYSHRWEVSGGGGYQRFSSGPYNQRNNEVSFFGMGQYALSPKLGVMGEVAGYYGNARLTNDKGNLLNNIGKPYNPQISDYTFTAGPSYRLRAKEKYAVTGYVSAGLAMGKFDSGSHGFTATNLGLWQDGFGPAFTAGVNLDYNFYPNLAVRVTPKYVGTLFSDTVQNSKDFNIGLVYRFGKIK
jgi:hypothetical protein